MDMDRAYANGAFIAGAETYPPKWAARAAEFRQGLGARQARGLSEAWRCDWTVAPGKHHFDVIDDLQDPGSALVAACLGGL